MLLELYLHFILNHYQSILVFCLWSNMILFINSNFAVKYLIIPFLILTLLESYHSYIIVFNFQYLISINKIKRKSFVHNTFFPNKLYMSMLFSPIKILCVCSEILCIAKSAMYCSESLWKMEIFISLVIALPNFDSIL